MESIQSLLAIILLFCLFLGIQPKLMASEPIDKTDILSSIQGYPRLEMAVDKYLMAIPSGYYTIANVEVLKSLMVDHQALLMTCANLLNINLDISLMRSIFLCGQYLAI